MRRVLALSLLLAAVAGAAARPNRPDAERQRAADARSEAQAAQDARTAAAEEHRLAQARVDAASRLRATESRLAELTAQLDALRTRQEEAERRLKADAAALAPTLPAVQRLARFPAETMLAAQLPPDDVVRGLLVLRSLAAGAAADAARVRAEEAELSRVQVALSAALPAMDTARSVQAAQSAQLDVQLAAARTAHSTADDAVAEAARRAAASAARAESLRGVVARIDKSRSDDDKASRREPAAVIQNPVGQNPAGQNRNEAGRPAGPGVAENQLLVPVVGTVLRSWGARTDSGQAQGISYGTPAGARVVSPCAGRVAFAGTFRSFGQLLIVDCGGGFHAVLAGPERLDVPVGRVVLAGEPVGVMGSGRPSLYVELRRGGQPVDPAPFLKGPFPRTGAIPSTL